MLGAILILAGLIFLFAEKKSNFPLLSGIIISITALPFVKLSLFLSSFENKEEFVNEIFAIFFSKSFWVFLVMFLLGLFLTIVGLSIKIFKLEGKIIAFFDKFKKKDGKKEEKK
jgi:hypothetical protein